MMAITCDHVRSRFTLPLSAYHRLWSIDGKVKVQPDWQGQPLAQASPDPV